MRIITWNVNGLRAALRKGFLQFVDDLKPDVILLQEIRVLPEQLPDTVANPEGWHVCWHPAEKKGYAGTAIWSRSPLNDVRRGLAGAASDPEGRVVGATTAGVRVVSIYLPSGSSSPQRQEKKERWMGEFEPWAAARRAHQEPTVLGGDFNIAHTEKDIFYARGNAKNSGFLPHERQWMGELIASGWSDVVRERAGDVQGPYSWWSNRGRARELDRGWRIDYLLTNAAAGEHRGAFVHREGGLKVSDHAPVVLDL